MGQPIRKIELANHVTIYSGEGPPPDGKIDVQCGQGSLYIDGVNAILYIRVDDEWVVVQIGSDPAELPAPGNADNVLTSTGSVWTSSRLDDLSIDHPALNPWTGGYWAVNEFDSAGGAFSNGQTPYTVSGILSYIIDYIWPLGQYISESGAPDSGAWPITNETWRLRARGPINRAEIGIMHYIPEAKKWTLDQVWLSNPFNLNTVKSDFNDWGLYHVNEYGGSKDGYHFTADDWNFSTDGSTYLDFEYINEQSGLRMPPQVINYLFSGNYDLHPLKRGSSTGGMAWSTYIDQGDITKETPAVPTGWAYRPSRTIIRSSNVQEALDEAVISTFDDMYPKLATESFNGGVVSVTDATTYLDRQWQLSDTFRTVPGTASNRAGVHVLGVADANKQILLTNNNSTDYFGPILMEEGQKASMEVNIMLPELATVADDFSFFWGFSGGVSLYGGEGPHNGIGIRYSRANNHDPQSFSVVGYDGGSVVSSYSINVPAVAMQWYRMRLELKHGNFPSTLDATLYVNGKYRFNTTESRSYTASGYGITPGWLHRFASTGAIKTVAIDYYKHWTELHR